MTTQDASSGGVAGGATTRGATGDMRRAVGDRELVGDLRRAKSALLLACVAWPVFALLDAAWVAMGGAGDLAALLVLRLAPLPWFVLGVVRVRRRPPISLREFQILVYGAIYVVMLALALECAVTGGMTSIYASAHLAVLATTTFVPRPWRKHAPMIAGSVLFYPVAMIVGALVYPPMQGQLEDVHALRTFGGNLLLLVTTAAIVVIGSHRLWSLRREIVEQRSIGRYELRRRIGKGGMGEVWAAWHRGLEREVALKILKLGSEEETDAAAVSRFEREVRLSSGLTHPHTVRVFDYGTTDDGFLYYAMELLKGASLGEIVRREGPMPAARAVHLVQQAARALAEAHARGIVHRDVKPENLFVTSAGGESDYVKVLDFGIARIASDAHQLTRTGSIAGTPSWMSPEVITGEPATPASDVYGLGAVLYHLLTGRPPFVGEVAASTLVAHLHEEVVPPRKRASFPVPADVEQIVLRALAKRPEHRYADGRELAEALATTSVAGSWVPGTTVVRPASVAPPSAPLDREAPTLDAVPTPASEAKDTAVAIRRPRLESPLAAAANEPGEDERERASS